MLERRFVLVAEIRPNDFKPIFYCKNMYDIEEIDKYTSKYSKEEFIKHLINENDIKDDNICDIQIIYADNGIRRLNTGVIFKEEYINNFYEYIFNFIKNNINDSNLLNDLYQKINNDKLISDYAKQSFNVLFENRHLHDDINFMLNYLSVCDYFDLRTLYLLIKKNIKIKTNNDKQKQSIVSNLT